MLPQCLGSHLVVSQTHCKYGAQNKYTRELFMTMVYMQLCNLVSPELNLLLFGGKFKTWERDTKHDLRTQSQGYRCCHISHEPKYN